MSKNLREKINARIAEVEREIAIFEKMLETPPYNEVIEKHLNHYKIVLRELKELLKD